LFGESLYNEKKFSYNEIPYKDKMVLNGYFQSEKYFSDYIPETKKLFNLSEEYCDKVIKHNKSLPKKVTSVHVRRGDYLNNLEYHTPCDVDYFNKAIELIGDSYFIFFSDDIEWVKENFKGKNFIYSNNQNEIEDFTFMTQCDNNIISNSSFSWWAAYLNDNKEKKVIAPQKWFGPKGPKDTQDIIPSEWIIL
jgi:hypothetical protein